MTKQKSGIAASSYQNTRWNSEVRHSPGMRGIQGSRHSTIEKAMGVDSADKATGQQGSQPTIPAQAKTGSLGTDWLS